MQFNEDVSIYRYEVVQVMTDIKKEGYVIAPDLEDAVKYLAEFYREGPWIINAVGLFSDELILPEWEEET